MLMFNIRSDLGGGSDSQQGWGLFPSNVHRHQPNHLSNQRYKHQGQRSVTTWEAVKKRCERTCMTKAWKKLAMTGLLTLHLGTMFAILSHNGVPLFLPDALLMQVLSVIMALGGATCVVMSVFVFRRQKRHLHPCMCIESGSSKEDELLNWEGDQYAPPTEGHSHQSFHHNHHVFLQSRAQYDVVRARLPERDISVVITTSPVQRETPHRTSPAHEKDRRDLGPSRHAYKNPAFEDKSRKHRAKSEPNVSDQRIRYKLRSYRGRPSLPVRGGHVDLEQLTMSSLV